MYDRFIREEFCGFTAYGLAGSTVVGEDEERASFVVAVLEDEADERRDDGEAKGLWWFQDSEYLRARCDPSEGFEVVEEKELPREVRKALSAVNY